MITLRVTLTLLTSFLCVSLHAQKATLRIRLVDTTGKSYKEYVFEATITNKSSRKLIIQDTNFIKENIEYPTHNLLSPYFYKKIGNQYSFIDPIPRTGVAVPGLDSCLEKCCGCITLKKDQSLKMKLRILTCCPLDPGDYKLLIGLRQPFMGMKRKYLRGEIESNEIYFSIK